MGSPKPTTTNAAGRRTHPAPRRRNRRLPGPGADHGSKRDWLTGARWSPRCHPCVWRHYPAHARSAACLLSRTPRRRRTRWREKMACPPTPAPSQTRKRGPEKRSSGSAQLGWAASFWTLEAQPVPSKDGGGGVEVDFAVVWAEQTRCRFSSRCASLPVLGSRERVVEAPVGRRPWNGFRQAGRIGCRCL